MAEAHERFDFHVRIEGHSLEALDALIREFQPHVLRVGPIEPERRRFACDALVSGDLRTRLERAGHRVEVIAHVNQPEDLRSQVSQTDRFAEELERLKKRPR